MNYPEFFNNIEKIKLKDELALTLGAFENGIVEFSYLDVVKAAGHSCPTVAGAYISVLQALKSLYENEMPKRGEIEVFFKDSYIESTTGVVANVISQITGATDSYGFKGLNGNFVRHSIMHFEAKIPSAIRFLRTDTKQFVDVTYDPSSIGFSGDISVLMKKVISNKANEEEKKQFRLVWQKRVEDIFENIDKVIKIEK